MVKGEYANLIAFQHHHHHATPPPKSLFIMNKLITFNLSFPFITLVVHRLEFLRKGFATNSEENLYFTTTNIRLKVNRVSLYVEIYQMTLFAISLDCFNNKHSFAILICEISGLSKYLKVLIFGLQYYFVHSIRQITSPMKCTTLSHN